MSRADSLGATGINKFILRLRYHEASRQWFAVLFVPLVCWFGISNEELFIAGGILVTIGELIRLWASGHVKKNKVLATDGPYAFVRHPLYVGNILILLGFSIASNMWWAYVLMVALLWFYYPPAISYEDARLEKLFGDQWREWRQRTRALIPGYNSENHASEPSDWSFRQSLMRNGEPVIALYLVACAYILSATI